MKETSLDYLTGLYTRQHLYQFYRNIPTDRCLHFMFIDIDNFKNVNDVYGHNEGDSLLQATASILQKCASQAQIIRLGGDEFVLLFVDNCSRDFLCQTATDIINRFDNKEGFSHISTSVSLSIGILYNETPTDTLDNILLKSDMAMYYAKSHGKDTFIVFNDIADQVFSEVEMEKRQSIALENQEFEIRYLPVISAQTSKLKLSQMRLFWNMPDGKVLSQEEFLPLFEKNGFIRQLSMWTIQKSLSHLKKFHSMTGINGKIGIRISRLLFLDANFPTIMEELVQQYNIYPNELDLEISENAFERGATEILCTLKALKSKGFSISIIDVGFNFQSLGYWDKIHFDSIMFDPEYVRNALQNTRGRQIIKTLLTMGRELKMYVMADGINTKEDALFLGGCGCNAISGAYYSEPLPLDKYYDYVQNKLTQGSEKTEFHFCNNLISADEKHAGWVIGKNVEFTEGINSNWGALRFPGGTFGENVVELPAAILAESSYTICMWLKPLKNTSWTSSFYARYQGVFCSFSPYVVGGNSIYRVSEDTDINGFHDAIARHIPKDIWTFVCITYDDFAGISKTYINGRKAGYRTDIPSLPACRQILLGGDPFQPSYQGDLSGLIIYGDVKSEEDIKDLYESFFAEPNFRGSMESFWME